MGQWKGLLFALLAASCAKSQGVTGPAPVPPPPAARAPSADSTAQPPQSPRADARPKDSVSVIQEVALDSAARAKAARDSALDAAMLARIAEAQPPAGTELAAAPTEAESLTLRELFDIDVANFEDHGRVKYWVDFFTGPARERMAIWLTRMPKYEPTFRAKLVEKGLPGDLAYLPLIESGYSPTAVSRARAVGMWQFMRATGRYYGLQVDGWVDERRDVSKATTAAVRYLGDLTQRFGSAYLAAAAYNGGPGRIQRGLNRLDLNDDDDEPADNDSTAADAGDLAFFQLADSRYIRKETKDYVPKLIAAAMIAKQPERYGFPIPMGGPLALDSIVVPDATGLDVVAELAGVAVADLRALNPHYLRELTPPKRKAVVRIPEGKGSQVQASLDALSPSARLGSFPHPSRGGETLTSLAKHYGVTLAAMKDANPELTSRTPKKGEVVKIPGEARLKGWVAANRKLSLAELGEGAVRHRVRSGETLGGIARRYRVTVSQLKAWNGLRSNLVRAGQVLRLNPGTRRAVSTGTRTTAAATAASAASAASKTHLVKTGDTLSSLARRYGTTIQALRNANNLTPGRALLRGQRLKIPS